MKLADHVGIDEPFAGLDPISLGVAANLIRRLNDATGAIDMPASVAGILRRRGHDVQVAVDARRPGDTLVPLRADWLRRSWGRRRPSRPG